jgi:serine/threonine protein kinase
LNAQKSIDVWAFGAVMFYLVTGKHLFEGKADIDGQWDPISCFQALASIPDSTAKDLLVDLFQENPEDRPPIGLFFSMISSVHKILLMKSAVSRTSCKKLSDTGDINSLRRDIAGITERLDMQKDGVLQINQKKVQVVFFGSDPKHRLLDRIDLGEEIRSIKMTAWAAFDRKALEFVECQATRSDDMELQLQTKNPDILHFSGLGTQSGEFLCNSDKGTPQTITKEALCALIGAEQRNLHLVFMNACYSNVQAEELSSVVDCVIGMSDRISDKAAIAFSGSFYQAIGFGKDVETAFKYGIAALRRKAPLE